MKKYIIYSLCLVMIFFISCKGKNSIPEVSIDKVKFENKIIVLNEKVYLEAEPFLSKLKFTPSVDKDGLIMVGYKEIDEKLVRLYMKKDSVTYLPVIEASETLEATCTVMKEYNTISVNTSTMPVFKSNKPFTSSSGVIGEGAYPLNPGTYINKASNVKNKVNQKVQENQF